MLVPRLLKWFAAHARDLPWRRTRDPYAIWVSESMLQQTQVTTVIPYWERWMRELPTLEALARAKSETIHRLWEGLGYYTRVRNLQKAAQQIVADHDGRYPRTFADILALPGVGRYTAGAIASIAFNQPAPILDGNVIRVLARLHGIGEDPRERTTNARLWELAEALVQTAHAAQQAYSRTVGRRRAEGRAGTKDTGACSALNQSLMELGALVCTPRSPHCAACPVATCCVALRENRVAELPRRRERQPATARRFIALVVERRGRFLVREREAGSVNAHLWEFPNWEVPANAAAAEIAREHLRVAPAALHALCEVRHSITRYRITTEAYRVRLDSAGGAAARIHGVWRTRAELSQLPFTSAHRRIERALEKLRAGA